MITSLTPRRLSAGIGALGGFLLALLLLLSSGAAEVHAQETATVVPSTRPTAPAVPTVRPKPAETVVGTGPNGATMRCRDGSYPAAGAPDSACESKGGLLVRFPLKRTPENAPRLTSAGPKPLPGDTIVAPAIRLEPVEDRSNVVVPAVRPPADATIQCGDGSYVVSDTASVRCAGKGGVAMRFPRARRR